MTIAGDISAVINPAPSRIKPPGYFTRLLLIPLPSPSSLPLFNPPFKNT
jgi:hypothetical protein